LTADREMCELLGDEFVQVFTAVKNHELNRFRAHVTDWEKNEYMEIY
jgi:glutamine synthetase